MYNAQVMRSAGYATAAVGKWDAGMATADHTPEGRGYEQSLIYFHHANDYWSYQVGSCNAAAAINSARSMYPSPPVSMSLKQIEWLPVARLSAA